MKKVAIVCNYALKPERIGGMDRFYVAYDRKLKAEGYKVDWYFSASQSFDFFSELNLNLASNQPVERLFAEKVLQDGARYDILITHFSELCTPFFKKMKKAGIGQIIAVDHNPRPLDGFPLSKRIKNKIKGVLYAPYIDRFIGVSGYTKRCILNDYGASLKKKTFVIYNGIDTSVFRKRSAANKNKFAVSSHLRPSKGIQDLLEAVHLLAPEIKNQIRIDVFGEGPYEAGLKAMAAAFGLTEIIQFKGSSPIMNELLAGYSYLLQPTYMECFSLSILESLAANVPVVTTTVGGNTEIIAENQNGFLFEPKDVQALSVILDNIIRDKMKIENDVSATIESSFNLELMVQHHVEMLSEKSQ